MYEPEQIDGVIIQGADDGDEVAGIIVQGADGDEVAGVILNQADA